MKQILILYLVALICIFPAGCEKKEHTGDKDLPRTVTDAPAYGDTLIVGSIGEPSVLIPMLAGDSASHQVAGLIFNGLVKYHTDLSVVGDLAESWDISSDGLVITFHLRHGVKWSDGVEFTADDVMFGYRTIIDDKTPTPYKGDYLQVQEAQVIDRHTFRVTYKKPFAPALTTWGNLVVLPKHLLQDKEITQAEFGRRPVGMGPFCFKNWSSGQEVTLEAYHDYFEGRPYLDRYIYKVIPDSATMFLELQAGGVDSMGLTPLQYTKQTESDNYRKNFQKFRYPSFSYTYMGLNLKHPWFKDRRVRQAIAHAIDKDEIVDVVLFGLGKPATGPYVPDTWPYNPAVKSYAFDPGKAKEILQEVGWEDQDGDGVLEKDGEPFEFTVLTNMGNNLRKNTATIIQRRLSDIGVKVHIRTLEWSTFINEFIDKRRFQAVILGWSIGLDPDQFDIWHSGKIGEKEFNFVSYSNSEVDELLERGRRTFDTDERKKAYFRIQEILAEDVPYIFLYVPDATPIVHARFHGIKPAPIGISYNLNRWYVPAPLQRHSTMKR